MCFNIILKSSFKFDFCNSLSISYDTKNYLLQYKKIVGKGWSSMRMQAKRLRIGPNNILNFLSATNADLCFLKVVVIAFKKKKNKRGVLSSGGLFMFYYSKF